MSIFFKVSVNKIWVSFLLKVYMAFAFAFALPLTSFVSIIAQWFPDCFDYDGDHILPWPSGVLYLTSHIQGDSVLTKHKDDMKHETFIDEPLILSTWLYTCAQGSPGFQGERRGDLPSPTEYKGLTIKNWLPINPLTPRSNL